MADMMGFMEKQPKWLVMVVGLIIVALIGVVDYLTGDYSILIFYLFPVSLVCWFAGRWAGMTTAVAGGSARFISDYSLSVTASRLYWNSLEDMIFLLIVAFLISLLKRTLESDRSAKP